LLLIRGYKWGDQWLIPGGHIEHGESVFDAARREAKEEVGLSIVPLGVVTVFEDIFPRTSTRGTGTSSTSRHSAGRPAPGSGWTTTRYPGTNGSVSPPRGGR
ncbi:MAG: NUDIX hydrolase, partial [Candidatus Micrarchaeota archaeon]|nr:NUDIX hydrolase [Candidatus Micrarchaeota archaeon]